jgi:RNA polymerase sigma-70 factor, ECF subfamily
MMTGYQANGPCQLVLGDHLDSLYGYAMALTRNRTMAEDLVQQACVRAMEASKSLRPDGNARAWLHALLRNLWIDQLRRRRASPEVDTDIDVAQSEEISSQSDPHAVYVSRLDTGLVREAILQLPPGQREVIVLREYEELSYEEIAKILNSSVTTVKSRLGRARNNLRALLAPTLNWTATSAKRKMTQSRS